MLDGKVALTSAFEDSAKGREEAAAQIAKITKAIADAVTEGNAIATGGMIEEGTPGTEDPESSTPHGDQR